MKAVSYIVLIFLFAAAVAVLIAVLPDTIDVLMERAPVQSAPSQWATPLPVQSGAQPTVQPVIIYQVATPTPGGVQIIYEQPVNETVQEQSAQDSGARLQQGCSLSRGTCPGQPEHLATGQP